VDVDQQLRRGAARQPAHQLGHQLGFESLGTPLIDTTFVVLDLETTGLSPASDRITEVGAVKVRGGEVLGELRTFVHPGCSIPPAITAVTGITDAMVRDAPSIAAVLPTVLRFLGDAVLVAHNAGFDVGFLRAAAAATGRPPFEPVVVDTARLARRLLRDEVRDCRLATVAQHLRARTRPEHRALADARATVDVLHGLIERAGAYGATTLEDLRDLARSSSDRSFRRIDLVRDAPHGCGTYRFLGPDDVVLYVGKATDLRSRLRQYFGQDPRRRIADLVRDTHRVTWTRTATLLEAEVLEVREIHRHRPHYNRRSTRPGAAVHVALTREPFPRLAIVRAPGPGHRRTIGPLPSRRAAQRLVDALHEVLGLRTCTPRLRSAQDHSPCVLKELGRCGAPCDGTQSAEDYAEVVARAEADLDDPSRLLRPLRERMLAAATAGRFERAGELRAGLHATARALTTAREHQALAGVDHLVASAPRDGGTDLAVIRRGRLAGSAHLEGRADDPAVLAAVAALDLDACAGPPAREDLEEVGLVLAWLGRPGVRVVSASAGLALPGAGGLALAAAVEEAGRVARDVRRDRQVLAGAKVRRRQVPAEALALSGPAAGRIRSRDDRSGREVLGDLEQPDGPVGLEPTEDQELAHEAGDALGPEVDRADDLPTDQVLLGIGRDLRAGRELPEHGAEIDAELVGGVSCLGEGTDLHDATDPQVQREEALHPDVRLALQVSGVVGT
jgi:DNA polymerase III subunit epsilon